jgi:hypothetical protein
LNFNISYLFIYLLTALLLLSCGVKAPPLKHPETEIDSYIQTINGVDDDKDESSPKKKN